MDKHDKELINFCLQHDFKNVDEGRAALEKFKVQETVKLNNEQEEQRKKRAEQEDSIRRATEAEHNKFFAKRFRLRHHDCPIAVVIDGDEVFYHPRLNCYLCPHCEGELPSIILNEAVRIGINVFPGLISDPPDSTRITYHRLSVDADTASRAYRANKPRMDAWRNEVQCLTCAKKLTVTIKPKE